MITASSLPLPWQGVTPVPSGLTAYALGWYGARRLPCTLEGTFTETALIGVVRGRGGGKWTATVLHTSGILESVARSGELLTWGRFLAPPIELYHALGIRL